MFSLPFSSWLPSLPDFEWGYSLLDSLLQGEHLLDAHLGPPFPRVSRVQGGPHHPRGSLRIYLPVPCAHPATSLTTLTPPHPPLCPAQA